MEMITKETKEGFQGEAGAVEKNLAPLATKSQEEMEGMLDDERYSMRLLLIYEVRRWEDLLWKKFKSFLNRTANDRVEVKERWTREWKANYWKRLVSLKHAAEKGIPGSDEWWGLFEGVEVSASLFRLRDYIDRVTPEIRLRMEMEMEDVEFRLKRGSDLDRFDQFWDEDDLFNCRYSRSKWAVLSDSRVPVEAYLHALKGNRNIIHVALSSYIPDSEVKRFHAAICDLPPWMTSISWGNDGLPALHRDGLYVKSTKNDLITFAKETRLKLDSSSTYIFTDAAIYNMCVGTLSYGARILISFVGPTSHRLILRLKHSGKDGCLEVTLGSTITQLNPSSESLTIDDITLHPIQDVGPSESHHLSFEPGVRNEIFIQYKDEPDSQSVTLYLHDVELLDEAGLEHMPRTF
jgi:hypothetical protein